MDALFVTATGTEMGKTYVTAGIIRAAIARHRAVGAIKPLMTGYDDQAPQMSDAGVLLQAMGEPVTAEAIAALSPWRFEAMLAPDMAAALEGKEVQFADLLMFCREAMSLPGLTLIEGIGGAMVPIDHTHNVRDWIAELEVPVLLVSGTYLGSISHTLTAAEALMQRDIPIAGIVLDESEISPVPPHITAASIGRFVPEIPIQIIPRHADVEAFDELAELVFNK